MGTWLLAEEARRAAADEAEHGDLDVRPVLRNDQAPRSESPPLAPRPTDDAAEAGSEPSRGTRRRVRDEEDGASAST